MLWILNFIQTITTNLNGDVKFNWLGTDDNYKLCFLDTCKLLCSFFPWASWKRASVRSCKSLSVTFWNVTRLWKTSQMRPSRRGFFPRSLHNKGISLQHVCWSFVFAASWTQQNVGRGQESICPPPGKSSNKKALLLRSPRRRRWSWTLMCNHLFIALWHGATPHTLGQLAEQPIGCTWLTHPEEVT